jgi:L-rhamnose isomerase/sugar isomerase
MEREQLFKLLDDFDIETPSWGFADTGTRFGKFLQPAAASTIDEKLADAGIVHKYTGVLPDRRRARAVGFFHGRRRAADRDVAKKNGIRIGAINPNLFQDQVYKFGSVCSPIERAQQHAHRHVLDSIAIGKAVGSKLLSLWFADGTNYPGQDDIVTRKRRMEGALRQWHDAMPRDMTMLVEYKPVRARRSTTPTSATGAWRTSTPNRRAAREGTRRHRPSLPVDQHRADRRVAARREHARRVPLQRPQVRDDDLTLGSIDPYAVFRIFHEIRNAADCTARTCRRSRTWSIKPQPQAEGRGDDPDGDHGTGAVRQSVPGRPQEASRRADAHEHRGR